MARLATGGIASFFEREGIPEESGFTVLAVKAVCVVNASETFASRSIAVTNCVGIDIVIAITFYTLSHDSRRSSGIAKVAVFAEFTTGPWKIY